MLALFAWLFTEKPKIEAAVERAVRRVVTDTEENALKGLKLIDELTKVRMQRERMLDEHAEEMRDLKNEESKERNRIKEAATDVKLKLKEELKELNHTKDLEERETKALIQLKEDKMKVEKDQSQVDLEKEFNKKEKKLLEDFHTKQLNMVKESKEDMQKIHEQILERLPNVNMRISDKRIEGTDPEKKAV